MLDKTRGVRRREKDETDLDPGVFGEYIPNHRAHNLRGLVFGIAVCTGRYAGKCDRVKVVIYG